MIVSTEFLKIRFRSAMALSVVASIVLVYLYACDTCDGFKRFQGWVSLGICLVMAFNAWAQLRRRREK